MLQLPIQALPNQQFQAVLDGTAWDFTLRSTNGVMSATLASNGSTVVENARCAAGSFLIPSRYEEAGNFLFLTADYALPDYTLFGNTQSLIYVSAAELAVFRAPPVSPVITAASFDPIAALPLRFAPQGYEAS
ncbi:hypothetical protein [Fimbriiglobus ruber]|uniref:Phage protein n=1 Tax=Fimbriiglobus ruber TaxID=1908690 RepID=A0A225DLF1_9BACT|nr:hypothetical protein [Fimbriiglobus ruber]OWK42202.1 Phage protein [Fimbriiglobus ruber]